jgi:hypothetical protein
VSPAGIEPATLCLEGRCSIQLSYGLLNLIVAAPDREKKIERAPVHPCHVMLQKQSHINHDSILPGGLERRMETKR